MRTRDTEVFRKAAQRFQAWILVRQTNKASLDFVGKRLYQPKPITCKAKSAKNAVHGKTIAGLVADPLRWPEAFAGQGADAYNSWSKFRNDHNLGGFQLQPNGSFVFKGARSASSGYAIDVEPGSTHEGCVTYEGKYLYGDYDLFDIVFPGATVREGAYPTPIGPKILVEVEKRNTEKGRSVTAPMRVVTDYRSTRWDEVKTFLNGQLGFELIQHGAEFDLKQGERLPLDFQTIDAFGPDGESATWSAAQTALRYGEWQRASV